MLTILHKHRDTGTHTHTHIEEGNKRHFANIHSFTDDESYCGAFIECDNIRNY